MNTNIPKPPPLPPNSGNVPPKKPALPETGNPSQPPTKPPTSAPPKPSASNLPQPNRNMPEAPKTVTPPVLPKPNTTPQATTSDSLPQPNKTMPGMPPPSTMQPEQNKTTPGFPQPKLTPDSPKQPVEKTPNIIETPVLKTATTEPEEPVRINVEEEIFLPQTQETVSEKPFDPQLAKRTFIIDTDDDDNSSQNETSTPDMWDDEEETNISTYDSMDEEFDNAETLYDYGNSSQQLKMGRESILPKILKPIIWLGVIAGLAVGGWLISPYMIQWFNMVFPDNTVEEETTTILQPIEITEETTEATTSGTYYRIDDITGETTTVSYLTTNQNTVEVELQLDSIERTTQFGSLLEVAKVQLRGTAPESLSSAQVEAGLEKYRFSIVRMNMVYTGEPLNLTGQPAIKIEYPTTDSNPIADSTPNIRNHYIINLSGGDTEAGIRFLIESQNCNTSETIPDEFWQGNYPIQACFIGLSPAGFDTVTYSDPATSQTVTFTGVYKE